MRGFFLDLMSPFPPFRHTRLTFHAVTDPSAPASTPLMLPSQGVGPSLHFLDMYSALVKVNFGAHGYAYRRPRSTHTSSTRADDAGHTHTHAHAHMLFKLTTIEIIKLKSWYKSKAVGG